MTAQILVLEEHWDALARNDRADLVWRLCREHHHRFHRYAMAEGPYGAVDQQIREVLEQNYLLEMEAMTWLQGLQRAVRVTDYCLKRFPDICRSNVYALAFHPQSNAFCYTGEGLTTVAAGYLSPELAATEILVLNSRYNGYGYDRTWAVIPVIGIPEVIAKIAELEGERKRIAESARAFLC